MNYRVCFQKTFQVTTLVEVVVAAVIFLSIFVWALGMLPRLAVRNDVGLVLNKAEYRVERALEEYGSGVWPDGEYVELYGWGKVMIYTCPYRDLNDMQLVVVRTRIVGCNRHVVRQLVVERSK